MCERGSGHAYIPTLTIEPAYTDHTDKSAKPTNEGGKEQTHAGSQTQTPPLPSVSNLVRIPQTPPRKPSRPITMGHAQQQRARAHPRSKTKP